MCAYFTLDDMRRGNVKKPGCTPCNHIASLDPPYKNKKMYMGKMKKT